MEGSVQGTTSYEREKRGLPSYVRGDSGFYVVNPRTNIAVARHNGRLSAEADATHRNDRYPADPLKLVVVEVSDV